MVNNKRRRTNNVSDKNYDPTILATQVASRTTLAQTLRESLQDTIKEQQQLHDNADSDKRCRIQISPKMIQQVMNAYTTAVLQHTPSTSKKAPKAILKGTVCHYNKMDSKWRIIIKDAQIHEKVEGNTNTNTDKQTIPLSNQPIMMLAYNDRSD